VLEQHSDTVTAVPETIQECCWPGSTAFQKGRSVYCRRRRCWDGILGRLLRAVWDGAEDLEPKLGALTRQELLRHTRRRGGHELRFQTRL
jgi:hypothetical protein